VNNPNADPGPWSVHEGFIYVEVHTNSGSEPEIIAKVHHTERGDVHATAHLIAAAPDMLVTLRMVRDWHTIKSGDFDKQYPNIANSTHWLNIVNAIIAKAEGRQ
jgi:hypothetical protein